MQAAQASYRGEAPRQTKGRCAATSNHTLDQLRLHSIVSYSIVWWMQAAQASYSGEAPHQKKGRCATISGSTLDRLRLHSIVSYRIVWWAAGPTSPEPPPKKQKVDETDYVQVEVSCKGFPTCTLERDMTLQQFDGERVVDAHYHKGSRSASGV